MRERGSVTLLLAFMVLAFVGVGVFLGHRNVAREWAMEGEALQGARAALAADSALAWFLAAWSAPPGPAGEEGRPDAVLAVPGEVFPPGQRQEGEIRVRHLGPLPGLCLDPLSGPCPDPLSGPCPDPLTGPCPDPLSGPCPDPLTGPCPDPLWGVADQPPVPEVWKVTLQGRHWAGGSCYVQTREAYVVTRGGAGAPPVLRAWRVVP